MASVKDQLTNFVKNFYKEKEAVPSLSQIRRELRISTRRLYSEFPGGIAEICKHADVPIPEERVKTVEKALEARAKRGIIEEAGEGELAARVFNLLEKGKPLPKVVIALRMDPDRAKELYDKWLTLEEVDVNQPTVLRGLRTLEGLAEATYSMCQTIDQVLFTLGDHAPLLFHDLKQINSFTRGLDGVKMENYRVLGAIIKACKGFNSALSASILKKSLELLGFSSLKHFIEDNGLEELGIDVDDLKDLGAEELEKLGATPEDLKRLGFKAGV